MRRRRWLTLMIVPVLLLGWLVGSAASAGLGPAMITPGLDYEEPTGRLPLGPLTTPDGAGFTTPEQAEAQYRAYVQRLLAEMLQRRPIDVAPADVGPLANNGDIRITGPNFQWGTGYFLDTEASSRAARLIWDVALKIVSRYWKTVGTLLTELTWFYDATVNPNLPATSKSYHSFHYYTRDGIFYKNGGWYYGARVETRHTMANGWSTWYSEDNRQWQEWLHRNPVFVRADFGCHFNDTAWIWGHTQNAYNGLPPVFESWNGCNYFNP